MSKSSHGQGELFAPAAPKPSPIVPQPLSPEKAVHWAVLTTKGAATACGLQIIEFFKNEGRALSPDIVGRIHVTLNRDDSTTTCERCKEHFDA